MSGPYDQNLMSNLFNNSENNIKYIFAGNIAMTSTFRYQWNFTILLTNFDIRARNAN